MGCRYIGMMWDVFVFIVILVGVILVFGLFGVINADFWWSFCYVILIFGMIFGNLLIGILLGLDRFVFGMFIERDEIEFILSYGGMRCEVI